MPPFRVPIACLLGALVSLGLMGCGEPEKECEPTIRKYDTEGEILFEAECGIGPVRAVTEGCAKCEMSSEELWCEQDGYCDDGYACKGEFKDRGAKPRCQVLGNLEVVPHTPIYQFNWQSPLFCTHVGEVCATCSPEPITGEAFAPKCDWGNRSKCCGDSVCVVDCGDASIGADSNCVATCKLQQELHPGWDDGEIEGHMPPKPTPATTPPPAEKLPTPTPTPPPAEKLPTPVPTALALVTFAPQPLRTTTTTTTTLPHFSKGCSEYIYVGDILCNEKCDPYPNKTMCDGYYKRGHGSNGWLFWANDAICGEFGCQIFPDGTDYYLTACEPHTVHSPMNGDKWSGCDAKALYRSPTGQARFLHMGNYLDPNFGVESAYAQPTGSYADRNDVCPADFSANAGLLPWGWTTAVGGCRNSDGEYHGSNTVRNGDAEIEGVEFHISDSAAMTCPDGFDYITSWEDCFGIARVTDTTGNAALSEHDGVDKEASETNPKGCYRHMHKYGSFWRFNPGEGGTGKPCGGDVQWINKCGVVCKKMLGPSHRRRRGVAIVTELSEVTAGDSTPLVLYS